MADISTNEIEATSQYGIGDFMNGLFGAVTEIEVEKAKASAMKTNSVTNTANPSNTITEAKEVAAVVPTQGGFTLNNAQLMKYGAIGVAVVFIFILLMWGMRKGGKK